MGRGSRPATCLPPHCAGGNAPRDKTADSEDRPSQLTMRKLLLLLQCCLLGLVAVVAAPLDQSPPDAELDGMYSECLSRLSVTCVQTKVLRFVRRLDRLEEFPLMGGLLSVVRVGAPLQLDHDAGSESSDPEPQLDRALDGFFDSHVLRVQLPAWGSDSRAADNFDIALRLDDDDDQGQSLYVTL